jgi:multiple sugar transport system permease protein
VSQRTGPAAPLALAATLLLALLWLFPLAWTVSTSLKDSFQTIVVPPRWLPSPVSFAEYSRIVTTGQVTIWLLNSLLTAGLVTVLTVGISAAAAYAFSQLRFPGHGLLFWLFLASLMVPFEALVVPLYQQVNAMGLLNTYAGIVLPQLTTPLAVFIFRRFFDGVPQEYREAAKLDGAAEWLVLARIYLPMSRGVVWAVAIIIFITSWNNFLWPFIVITSPEMMTITVGLTQVQSQYGVQFAAQMASAILGGLPVALLYLAFQNRVNSGFLAASGLKG